jgi:hypothetical protein
MPPLPAPKQLAPLFPGFHVHELFLGGWGSNHEPRTTNHYPRTPAP